MQPIASKNAPHPSVVVPHFVAAALAWFILTLLIVISPQAFTGHYFNPHLLGITHLAVLGWGTMMIFGVLYQLIPVILESTLFSETLAKITGVLLACGAGLLAFFFWTNRMGLPVYLAAVFILAAVVLFSLNIFISSSKAKRKSIEKRFILTAILWLLFTVSAGFALAVNLVTPYLKPLHLELLKLHAHAGLAGWFILLIMGVGARLLPMFLVSHGLNEKKLHLAYYLVNAGLLLALPFLYIGWKPGILGGSLLVVAGIAAFLTFLREAFRKRAKRHLDTGMRLTALAIAFLTLATLLFILLAPGNLLPAERVIPLSVTYGTMLVLGFISLLIQGQTYKTLPFIIWLKAYRHRVGRGKIPMPRELFNEKLARWQYYISYAAFIALLYGIFHIDLFSIRIGGVLLLAGASIYLFNILKIISHKPVKHEQPAE